MLRQNLLVSILFIFSASCSQLQTGRTFLTEMNHNDETFFNPQSDFPVVSGDTGRYWTTEKERQKRTPSSEFDIQEDLGKKSINRELKQLENSLSEEDLEFYEANKKNFLTPSEKIYFLKLPRRDKRDYLVSRGFISDPRNPTHASNQVKFAVRNQDVLIGMSKNQVMESWGRPQSVEVAGNPRNENERWIYRMNGASKYIYFEGGEVQGWE